MVPVRSTTSTSASGMRARIRATMRRRRSSYGPSTGSASRRFIDSQRFPRFAQRLGQHRRRAAASERAMPAASDDHGGADQDRRHARTSCACRCGCAPSAARGPGRQRAIVSRIELMAAQSTPRGATPGDGRRRRRSGGHAMPHGSFAWDVPPEFNFARDVIDALARGATAAACSSSTAAGARPTITFAADRGRVAALGRRAAGRWASAAASASSSLLPKIPAWLFAMLALTALGAVVVPCAEQLRAKDLAFRAESQRSDDDRRARLATARKSICMRAHAPGVQRYLLVGRRARGLDRARRAGRATPSSSRASRPRRRRLRTSSTPAARRKIPKASCIAYAYTYAKRMQAALLARLRGRTISSGARPAPAGRSRCGTCCSARGRAVRRSCCTRAASIPPSGWI